MSWVYIPTLISLITDLNRLFTYVHTSSKNTNYLKFIQSLAIVNQNYENIAKLISPESITGYMLIHKECGYNQANQIQ